MWLSLISVFICVFYFVLISTFYVGWQRTLFFDLKSEVDYQMKPTISVVVACKNEESNLPKLVESLASQSYSCFEVVLVDDHSTDCTLNLMNNSSVAFSQIKVLSSTGFGKKNALKEGILAASGELIITTDADCIPGNDWLRTVVDFQVATPSDLIICPVKFSDSSGLFSKLQTLEFASLVASGGGAAGAGMPIMCNGANLCFTKKIWLDCQSELHFEEQSGDDMFLLQSIKKRKGVIRFLKAKTAFLETASSRTLSEFFHQRSRWTSKSPVYTDYHIIASALIILGISVWQLVLLFLSFHNHLALTLFCTVFFLKYVLDVLFLSKVSEFFQLSKVWSNSLLLSVIYPWYIVSVAVKGLCFKSNQWKRDKC